MWWNADRGSKVRALSLTAAISCALAGHAPAQAGGPLAPLQWNKEFLVDPIVAGGTTTLLFAISNTNAATVDAVAFTDNLPAGLEVVAAGSNGCGGTVTAMPGSGVISLSGGSISANTICAFEVTVTGDMPGLYVNVTGDLTSSTGNSGPTTDTLEVNDGPVSSLEIPAASTLGLFVLGLLLTMAGAYLTRRRAGR